MINADEKEGYFTIEVKGIVSDIHYIVVESDIKGIEVNQTISLLYEPERNTPFTLITYRTVENHIHNICRHYEKAEEVEEVLEKIVLRKDTDWAIKIIQNMQDRIAELELIYLER